LDSLATTVLFHSHNLPSDIHIGTDFSTLVGAKHHKMMKDRIKLGERIDIDNVNFAFKRNSHLGGLWTEGVRVCLTPMKDQINEVGAVVALIQSPTQLLS
jgi:hypothetical protein